MAVHYMNGYPATAGGKVIRVGFIDGPAAYVNPGGQVYQDSSVRSIDWLGGGVSVSGTYEVVAQPQTTNNTKTWFLRWKTIADGLEVAADTDLSAESVQFCAICS